MIHTLRARGMSSSRPANARWSPVLVPAVPAADRSGAAARPGVYRNRRRDRVGVAPDLVNQLDQSLHDASHRSAMMASYPPPARPDGTRPIRTPGPGPDFLDAPGQQVGIVAAVVDYDGNVHAGVLTTFGQRAALTPKATEQVARIQPYHDPVQHRS